MDKGFVEEINYVDFLFKTLSKLQKQNKQKTD